MAGRCGMDKLNMVLYAAAVILLLISLLLGGTAGRLIWTLGALGFAFGVFRFFSRNTVKRSMENQRLLRLESRTKEAISSKKERMSQRKDYCFFKCPSCKSMMRVPRGKGKVSVTCRRCGERFIRNT